MEGLREDTEEDPRVPVRRTERRGHQWDRRQDGSIASGDCAERHSQGQPQGNGSDSDQPTSNISSTINYMVPRNGHIFSGLRIIVLELPKALFFFLHWLSF